MSCSFNGNFFGRATVTIAKRIIEDLAIYAANANAAGIDGYDLWLQGTRVECCISHFPEAIDLGEGVEGLQRFSQPQRWFYSGESQQKKVMIWRLVRLVKYVSCQPDT